MQRKIVRMICFKRKFDTVTKFFSDNKILTVHELYVYDLMKFCLRSLNQKHPTCFLNSLLTFKNFAYNTRISEGRIFVPLFCKNKVKSCSLTNRGSQLLNIMSINELFLKILDCCQKMKNTVSSINSKIISYVAITSWCKTYFFEFFNFKKWYPLAKCYKTTILGLRFYAENMTLQILVFF